MNAFRSLRLILFTLLVILISFAAGVGPSHADSGAGPDLKTYPVLYQRPGASTDPSNAVSLIMVGDTSMARKINVATDKYGVDYPLAKAAPYLQAADLAVGNYEGTIVTPGVGKERTSGRGLRFRADPEVAAALKRAGFGLVNLANNHTMDWGPAGLEDTIKNLTDAGIVTIGAGPNGPAARQPVVTTIKGVRIVWLGFTIIPDRPNNDRDREDSWTRAWLKSATDRSDMIAALKQAHMLGDVVIVQFHWGEEYDFCPKTWQVLYAQDMINAGAALVVGHHPHVEQSIEQYGNGLIAYSLGNFLFDQEWSPGLALWIRADKDGVIDVHGLTMHPGITPEWRTGAQAVQDYKKLCRLALPPTPKP